MPGYVLKIDRNGDIHSSGKIINIKDMVTIKNNVLYNIDNVSIMDISAVTNSTTALAVNNKTYIKPNSREVLFTKVSDSKLKIPQGFLIVVNDTIVIQSADTILSLDSDLDTGTKLAGTDYYVYSKSDATYYISIDKTITTDRLIGGFHYGLTPVNEVPTGNKTTADITNIAGINKYSFWDLKFKPVSEPEGMVFISGKWYDIYLTNSEHISNGTSKAGATIAGGESTNGRDIPKIPLAYGGNNTVRYTGLTWFQAGEIARSHSKKLISYDEFPSIAYGVKEATSSNHTTIYEVVRGAVEHYSNLTSKFGIEQATGVQGIWSTNLMVIGTGVAPTWIASTNNRGSINTVTDSPTSMVLGGDSDSVDVAGSCSCETTVYVWSTTWNRGLRLMAEHIEIL